MRIFCFSDTHIGSAGGLIRPGFEFEDTKFSSQIGNKIWRFFKKTLKKEKDKIDIIIFAGDLLHGIPKEPLHSHEVLLPSLEAQRAAALYSLGEILPDNVMKIACTGSHYHDAEEYPLEAQTLKEMGFRVVDQFKSIQIGHIFINLAHSKGSREQLAPFLEKTVKTLHNMGNWPQIIIRGHYHRFCALRFPDCIAISLPALEDSAKRYSLRVSAFPFNADIGIVIIDTDNDYAIKYYKFEK